MKSDDLVIKEVEDPAEIVKMRDQREKRCDHTTRKNELRSTETSILPYPKDGERAMINEWADSVMREFDELVEGEKKPAPAVNRRHHRQWNDAPHRADQLHPKPSSDNLVNGRAVSILILLKKLYGYNGCNGCNVIGRICAKNYLSLIRASYLRFSHLV